MEDLVRSLPDTFQEFSAAINSFLNLLETADNED